MGPPWPAGDSVFTVTDAAQLVRLDAADGSVIWAADLPGFVGERPRRRKAVHCALLRAHPRRRTQILVASTDGLLRAFSRGGRPARGRRGDPGRRHHRARDRGAARSTLVTREGQLLAYR